MIDIKAITKSFPNNFKVLDGIDLIAKDGEFICVVGPTGCGKTVLLYLIAGFIKPTSGSIYMKDLLVTNPGLDRIMVFQDYVLFPWKTVIGNIVFGLHGSKIKDHKKREAMAMNYLDLVGLSSFKDWPIYKLSGGMRQRVALARALIVNPKILLMDEPFSALDSQYRKFMRKNLVEIWRKTKKTVVFVTHSINEAVYLADKIYVLSSRPAKVKSIHEVNLPRPRDVNSVDFINIAKKIELDLSLEFDNISYEHESNNKIDVLIKEEL